MASVIPFPGQFDIDQPNGPASDVGEGLEVGDDPTFDVGEEADDAIDRLKDKDLHRKVLNYLTKQLEASEREMSRFWYRWQVNELKVQAYITLPDWENELKRLKNEKGAPPAALRLVVPFAYAAHSTAVTFLMSAFASRRPLFPISTYKDEEMELARRMETNIQYQNDHIGMVKVLWQFFSDILLYGVGPMGTAWKEDKAVRTVRNMITKTDSPGRPYKASDRSRKVVTTYEGNDVWNIDPYLFFPDPRCPMADCNVDGDYYFFRNFVSRNELKKGEAKGDFKYTEKITAGLPSQGLVGVPGSNRSLISQGDPFPGSEMQSRYTTQHLDQFVQLDEGPVTIVPKDLGLGTSEQPQVYYFTVANKNQIIQATRLDNDHDKLPLVVSEPTGFGHGFGQPAMMDYVTPIQDLLSWLVNSHIENVRLAINNMFVVDPMAIEMQDLKRPGPGKVIRLKQSRSGQDVKQAIYQLSVNDVTRGNVGDVQMMMGLGNMLLGFTDLMGNANQGGDRKTATEVRNDSQLALSRLNTLATVISAQAIIPLSEQMVLNTIQYQSEEFMIKILGAEGARLLLAPHHEVGDFSFPSYDGILPPDKIALFQIWRELTQAASQSEILSQTHDIGKMFEHTAELGGARNIEEFRRQGAPPEGVLQITPTEDGEVQDQAQAGNLVPVQPQAAANPAAAGLPAPPGVGQAVQALTGGGAF